MCQRVNRKMTAATPELHPIPVKSPWFHTGIDFIGPITPILGQPLISDYFTKFPNAVALPDKSASGAFTQYVMNR